MADYAVLTPDLGSAPLGTGGVDQRAAFTELNANWTSWGNAASWDSTTYDITLTGGLAIGEGFLSAGSPTPLTIASGVITATRTWHTVDTEASAATDDLDTINGGVIGDILILSSVTSARDTTIKHATGNIYLSGAADFTLTSSRDRVTLMYDGTSWTSLSTSNNE